MIRTAVWARDLSDSYLRKCCQLGADCLDAIIPPSAPEGYFDLDGLLEIKRKVHSYGMQMNRISLPLLSEKFLKDQDGGEEELEIACKSLQVLGEAGAPQYVRIEGIGKVEEIRDQIYSALDKLS